MAELTDEQQQFLLGIVEDLDSDYDYGLEGWPTFYISSAGELTVTFESNEEDDVDRTIAKGRWKLTYLDGSVEPKEK